MNEKKKKILIIEDDSFISGLYFKKLSNVGYSVDLAYDGEEGLQKIKTFQPDLILLDIQMPKMNGYQVLDRLNKDPQLKEIPVVLLTNLGQSEEIRKGKELGVKSYLIKAHYTPAEIVEKINDLLGQIDNA